jgi:hypothetical protein
MAVLSQDGIKTLPIPVVAPAAAAAMHASLMPGNFVDRLPSPT